jgi:hypothetical protein
LVGLLRRDYLEGEKRRERKERGKMKKIGFEKERVGKEARNLFNGSLEVDGRICGKR